MRGLFVSALLAVAVGCSPAPSSDFSVKSPGAASASPSWRPVHWAEPLCPRSAAPSLRRLSLASLAEEPSNSGQLFCRPGLPNLHRVDDGLYRGAQPDALGMQSLHEMGIKTVVNLRSLHSDTDLIGSTPLRYEHIPTVAWHAASDDDIVRFLAIATDPAKRPVFIHCQHGADRTGMMTAIYRVVVQGWSKQEAVNEMVQGGFGYHSLWHNLVSRVEELDVAAIKAQLDALPRGR